MKKPESGQPPSIAPPDLTTRPCPYCRKSIPAQAALCSFCWTDLRTGKHFQFDQTPQAPASATTAAPEPAHRQAGNLTPALGPAQPGTKTCIHCGSQIPDRYMMCPVCSLLQDGDIKESANRVVRARWKRDLRRIAVLVAALALIGGLAYAAYRNRDLLNERWTALWMPSSPTRPAPSTPASVDPPAASSDDSPATIRVLPYDKPEKPAPSPRPAVAAAPQPAPRPAPLPSRERTIKVVCRSCGGEGYYMRNATDRDRCPVCEGQGSRSLRLPEGYKVCPDCGGMGRAEELPTVSADRIRSGHHRNAHECRRCAGQGLVRGG